MARAYVLHKPAKIMKRIRKIATQDAFTMIEIMIALVVLSIGIMGIISLQGFSLFMTDHGGNMTTARILAVDQINRLTGVPFTDASLTTCGSTACGQSFCRKDIGGGAVGATAANLDNTGAQADAGRFKREWDVYDLVTSATGVKGMKCITVRVTWTDTRGGDTKVGTTRKVEMSSIRLEQ